MGRKSNGHEDSMLRLVAHLYYIRELNLKEISEITSLSPATISRMNRLARERKVVTITVATAEAAAISTAIAAAGLSSPASSMLRIAIDASRGSGA